MTTGPIGLTGSTAAAQDPLAGGDWAGARNYVRRDAGADPGAPASAPAAPAATSAAAEMPGQQGLVPTVLELPGDLLNLVFGKPAAAGPAATMEPGMPGSAAGPPASAPGAAGNPTGARNYIGRDPVAAAPTGLGPPPAAANQPGLVQKVLELPGNLLSRISGPQPAAVATPKPAAMTAQPEPKMGTTTMATAPIGPGGPPATPVLGSENWASARNYIGPDTGYAGPAAPNSAAAAHSAAPATPPGLARAPGQQKHRSQDLVSEVLQLPGNLLNRLAGPEPMHVPAPAPKVSPGPGAEPSHQTSSNPPVAPAPAFAQPGPAAGPPASAERRNAMTTDPIGVAGPAAAPQPPTLGAENWASARNYIGPDTGPVAPSPAATPAAAPATPPGLARAPGQEKHRVQELVPEVLELPGELLNALFGTQSAQSLGMSQTAYTALAAERPWQVASKLLGAPGTLDAAAFAQIEAMPGPLAGLLRAGAEPRAALAVQERWVVLNSQVEEKSGLTLLPSHQGSGWASTAGDARAILGTTPRAIPLQGADLQIMALGGTRVTPLASEATPTGEARPTPLPANATAVAALPDRTPVAISREIADQIALPAPMPLGAGLTLQHDPGTGAVIVGFEAAGASQVLGPLAPQVAAALAPALAEALAGVQSTPRSIDISVSMTLGADGMPVSLAVSGKLALADGTVKPFGTAPTLAGPQGGPTATPQEMPATAVLHLSGGADAGADNLAALLGPYIEYMRPTPVPLDLATGPGAEALPDDTRLWRMDDTRIFVALGTAGATEAMLEAARLHRAAIAGNLTLEDMPPGSGFETWDGSLLSLGLAGIRKTSVAAAEETPPRVRALHLDNDTWRASRGPREVSATAAGEDLRLFLAYGLDPAHAAGKGPQGGLAEQARTGFADALLQMERVRLAWWLPPGEVARRQEAWASVAREWATTLAGLDAAGPPVLPPGMPPAEALLAIAAQQGSAAAWSAFQASGLDLGALLEAAGEHRAALSEALTGGALLAAGRLGVPADRATAPGTEPADLALAAAREAFLHAVVATERGTLPREALEAALDAYGEAALAHLTEGEPLAHGDQGALAARLGHAAQTDVERGYLAPYLRLGRINDTAPEDGDQAQRRTG